MGLAPQVGCAADHAPYVYVRFYIIPIAWRRVRMIDARWLQASAQEVRVAEDQR
jgi:hypothetical protein